MSLRKARAVRPDDPGPLDGNDQNASLLASIGEVAGNRALVLGRGSLDVMCGLIRAGATEVTELCRNDRPEAASADVVVVPDLATGDLAPGIVERARRALTGAGRIVLRCPIDPSGRLIRSVNRALRLHGFSTLRQQRIGMRVLVTAKLSFPGMSGPRLIEGGLHGKVS
jgi:hypothetical protein